MKAPGCKEHSLLSKLLGFKSFLHSHFSASAAANVAAELMKLTVILFHLSVHGRRNVSYFTKAQRRNGKQKDTGGKDKVTGGGGFRRLSECKDGHEPSPFLLLLASLKLTCSNTWLLMNALHTIITCLQLANS